MSNSTDSSMNVVILLNNTEISQNAYTNYLEKIHKPNNTLFIFHANIAPSIPNVIDFKNLNLATEKITELMTAHNKQESELKYNCEVEAKKYGIKSVNKMWKSLDSKSQIGEEAINYAKSVEADLIVTGSRGL